MVVKQLFDKFEPQDTMSLINMNHLKQPIGLKTLESNPQTMFEQIAALENQFKTSISDSEKIAIAIEKLPAEYQPVLSAKMRKEGSMLSASHIENATFQYWHSVHGSYTKNLVINAANNQDSESGKEVALAAFNGICNRCGYRGHKEAESYTKEHINGQTLMPKASGGQGSNSNQENKKDNNNNNTNNNQKKKCFQGNCNYCSKFGHKEADCHKKVADQKNGENEAAAVAVSNGNNVKFCCVQKLSMG